MSTRSCIILQLNKADRYQEFQSACGEIISPKGNELMYVYLHNGGPVNFIVQYLSEMFLNKEYDRVLDYILEGDRFSVKPGGSYYSIRKEILPPSTAKNLDEIAEEYPDIEVVYTLEPARDDDRYIGKVEAMERI